MHSILNSSAALILAGTGALITDLSGALGIFMEGFMGFGAFFSWVFAEWTGSVFWGTLLSAILASLAGWVLALFVRISGANPFIAGLALNLAVSGLTNTLSTFWFGTKGVLRSSIIGAVKPINIFPVAYIPFFGKIISGYSPFFYAAIFFVFVSWYLIKKTSTGLRLRACGIAPEACLERGIKPYLYREGAWAAAAFLGAIAGASLTFRIGAYTPGITAGRGWIALAAVFLGFRNVWGVVAAALVFTLAERAGYGIQTINKLPASAFLGIPSAIALILYTLSNWAEKKKLSDS